MLLEDTKCIISKIKLVIKIANKEKETRTLNMMTIHFSYDRRIWRTFKYILNVDSLTSTQVSYFLRKYALLYGEDVKGELGGI